MDHVVRLSIDDARPIARALRTEARRLKYSTNPRYGERDHRHAERLLNLADQIFPKRGAR